MTICKIEEIKNFLKPNKKILGLDVGSKTIGVSISNSELTMAMPLTTIRRTKFARDYARLAELIEERNVGALIIGLPLGIEGEENRSTQSVRTFARNILNQDDIVIAFQDERFSTQVMENHLIDQDVSRTRREQVIDKMAATHILQGALEQMQNDKY